MRGEEKMDKCTDGRKNGTIVVTYRNEDSEEV
jgi:hypothetical protein